MRAPTAGKPRKLEGVSRISRGRRQGDALISRFFKLGHSFSLATSLRSATLLFDLRGDQYARAAQLTRMRETQS